MVTRHQGFGIGITGRRRDAGMRLELKRNDALRCALCDMLLS